MIDDREQLDRYLALYDDLAVEVLDDPAPNTQFGLPYSNPELVQIVLQAMDWEMFDLFQKVDYEKAFKSEDPDEVRAYAFIAFLRMMLFGAACARMVGEIDFNTGVSALSEYWFKKLTDRFESVTTRKKDTEHTWLH